MEWSFRNEKESYCHDYFLCLWIFDGCFAMTNLDKLIDAVDRGVDTAHHHASAFPSESAYGKCTWHDSHKASSGSLDAAKALHEALLGEVHWYVNNMGEACVIMSADGEPNFKGDADNPARAWILAILKAYRGTM